VQIRQIETHGATAIAAVIPPIRATDALDFDVT